MSFCENLLQSWYHTVPTDPFADLSCWETLPEIQRKKMVNGISRNVLGDWTPCQLALSWGRKDVVNHLLFMGADMDAPGKTGMNPLHVLLILLYYRPQESVWVDMLLWWLKHGVDIHRIGLFFTEDGYEAWNPIDLLNHLVNRDKPLIVRFPRSIRVRISPTFSPSMTNHIEKAFLILLCFGARPHIHCPLLDPFLSWSWEDLAIGIENGEDLLSDFSRSLFHLPSTVSPLDLSRRVKYWGKHGSSHFTVDVKNKIKEKRRQRFTDKGLRYYDPCFEEDESGMTIPEEFVSLSEGKHAFAFHKTLIPYFLREQINPLTRKPIDVSCLHRWLKDVETDGWTSYLFDIDDYLHPCRVWTIDPLDPDKRERQKIRIVMDHILKIVTTRFTYSNIIKVFSISSCEISYLCHVLSMAPYHFHVFRSLPLEIQRKDLLLQMFVEKILLFLQDSIENAIVTFCFVMEEILQDIHTYSMIHQIMRDHKQFLSDLFRKDLLEILFSQPDIADLFRDRVGYIHLHTFQEIWNRLLRYHTFQCAS